MKGAVTIALRMILATVIFIALLEGSCRLAGRPLGSFTFASGKHGAPHPASESFPLYWGPIAYQVTTNGLGFRCGPDCNRDSSSGYDIIALGDSYTYGFFVDEARTYPSQLESVLASNGTPGRVFNMGIPGAALAEEMATYRHFAPAIPSHWVFLQFYANDLAGNNTPPAGPENTPALLEGVYWLLHHSAAFEAALEYYLKSRSDRFMGAAPGEARFDDSRYTISGQLDFEQLVAVERRAPSHELDLSLGQWDASTSLRLQQYGDALAVLQRLVNSHNARLAFIYVPTFLQVYDAQASNRLQQELQQQCEALGIPFLDTTPALRNHSNEALYLMPLDSHLNPRGLEVVALEAAHFYRTLNPRR